MTSGSRGIHVVAPLRRGPDSNTVRTVAGEWAEELAARLPDQLTTSWRKEGRGGRVLVDAARNTYAQTAVAPYAVRAKPGAPVATPLFWEEVADAEPRGWTLRDVPARLAERGDPWEGIAKAAAALRR
jgi:bifunctional non-homologous end joining protein LigD